MKFHNLNVCNMGQHSVRDRTNSRCTNLGIHALEIQTLLEAGWSNLTVSTAFCADNMTMGPATDPSFSTYLIHTRKTCVQCFPWPIPSVFQKYWEGNLKDKVADVFSATHGINMKTAFFWEVMLCSLVQRYLHFGVTCYLQILGRRVNCVRKWGHRYKERWTENRAQGGQLEMVACYWREPNMIEAASSSRMPVPLCQIHSNTNLEDNNHHLHVCFPTQQIDFCYINWTGHLATGDHPIFLRSLLSTNTEIEYFWGTIRSLNLVQWQTSETTWLFLNFV
jgi:hypothetical protein